MKNNEYYMAYDTIKDSYIPSTAYKHESDTQEYIESQRDSNRLVVRKVQITEV